MDRAGKKLAHPHVLVSDKPTQDKRFTWLFAGFAFNTITSITAIALWGFAPTRIANTSAARPESSSTLPPFSAPRVNPQRPYSQLTPGAPPSAGDAQPTSPPPPRIDTQFLDTSPNVTVTASTETLAKRVNLRPDFLAESLGDEKGEIPKGYASRLEKAFDAAKAFTTRLKLTEPQTQSVVAIFTHYELSVLREEKAAAPGPANPTRLEALTNEAITSIRATCGEDTSAAAADELERL